eukprot:CAMPEP_0203669376 /NCGR_PEP_ID=MMETSP0090-20130426/5782_1 /ASSEMBLY_ACC=CAM_ASM_001088 /TAXON_ID=426623 /ORGANISM="Chaetoceros affinis, Strain CCMP159" /LENGTH=509 /DNA_ID=CAMNT_0050534061 /DNA_START=128 /DNA_END=1653 /DNA_ORIENTATION=-
MAQPGSSSVYYGGSIIYNTKKAKSLFLNDETLHASLANVPSAQTKEEYIQSKIDWTAKTSVEFCKALGTDYAISEGGAAGPTFRFDDMENGFAVLSVAGRRQKQQQLEEEVNNSNSNSDEVRVLKQTVVHSPHADREKNMRFFADAAADLLAEVIHTNEEQEKEEEEEGCEGQNNGNIHNKIEPETQPKESGVKLDRATSLRTDETALAGMETRAKYVLVKGNDILVRSASELAMLPYEEVAHLLIKSSTCTTCTDESRSKAQNQKTFLGLLTDEYQTPIFGIDITVDTDVDTDSDSQNNSSPTSFEGCNFVNTRTSAPLLPPLENEIALHIMAYANWQRKSQYCSSCGSPLDLIHAGTAQQCSSCRAMSWPRQDPSMIVSVTSRCGEYILLARSKRHPPKVHTVLAGFVEAGEKFEAAVSREVWEETGIRVDEESVTYIGSQSWPFPQSCMIAFSATADDQQELDIDEDEIVEARWFHRDEVLKATAFEGEKVMDHEVAKTIIEADPS